MNVEDVVGDGHDDHIDHTDHTDHIDHDDNIDPDDNDVSHDGDGVNNMEHDSYDDNHYQSNNRDD